MFAMHDGEKVFLAFRPLSFVESRFRVSSKRMQRRKESIHPGCISKVNPAPSCMLDYSKTDHRKGCGFGSMIRMRV